MKNLTTDWSKYSKKTKKTSWSAGSQQIFGSEKKTSVYNHYAAKVSDEQVDKVIHIQLQKGIAAHDIVIIDEEQFDIEKIDQIKDALPPITKLSLVKLEKHRQKEFA